MRGTLFLFLCLFTINGFGQSSLPTNKAATQATKPASKAQAKRAAADERMMPSNWDGGFYVPSPDVEPDSNRGVYAIWTKDRDELLDLPFLKGGQAAEFWGNLESDEGIYDFSSLDQKLNELAKRNLATTIQVNGNTKPTWLFKKCPYMPKQFGAQVQDTSGTLAYWHPVHQKAYLDFLKAFAEHIRNSPHRQRIIGVRMNFNARGTEGIGIPASMQVRDQWIVPKGVEWVPYSAKSDGEYESKIVDAFIKDFDGVTKVLVRGTVSGGFRERYREQIDSGKLGWFYTGMTAKPPANPAVNFFLDCRSGKTVGYGEPYADSWGYHGNGKPRHDIPAAMVQYWRVLTDLHLGLSFIAVYGDDLGVALDGQHPKKGDQSQLKEPINETLRFAAKYAGYHASPRVSPGAWIAFRQLRANDDRQKLWDAMCNDCTFLMKRLPGKTIANKQTIGSPVERYGMSSRVLPAGESMQLMLDPLFAESIDGKSATLKIIYFDQNEGQLTVECSGEKHTVILGNSGQWKSASFAIPKAEFSKSVQAHILLTAPEKNVTLHMVEVTRE